MDTPPIQNAIKLVGFQVQEFDFKTDPACFPDGVAPVMGELQVEIGFGIGFNNDKPKKFSVAFETRITDTNKYLNIYVKSSGVFETDMPITEEFKSSSFVKLNSPAIVFPFLRSFITTVTTNAGIAPIILPAFNFTKTIKVPELKL
jgi:preprotein translocase subunit SecB